MLTKVIEGPIGFVEYIHIERFKDSVNDII